ncbi:hypothetical protein BU23DRAFT_558182, partial [Bimuria novae-zelandiae CBS 107.79]
LHDSTITTESDPTTTRVTIFLRKDAAQQHDLWQYCNPDVAIANLPLLIEPVEPIAHQYKVTEVPSMIYANANLNNNKF